MKNTGEINTTYNLRLKRLHYVMNNMSEGVFSMRKLSTKKLSEYLFLWTLGGCLYYFFEVFFRGFSHWSMFILGGICMVFFTVQGQAVHWEDALWRQVLRCIIFVTAMEFITGIIVNKWLHMAVWDYSNHDHLLRTVRAWDLPWGISFLLAVWGREAALPCSLEIK